MELQHNTSSSSDLAIIKPTISPLALDIAAMVSGSGYMHGLVASLAVIIVSEIGDKTFFIAAILAMKSPRLTVFTAAMLALLAMTVISTVVGIAINVVPKVYIHYTSILLFIVFGFKMLKEAYDMSGEEAKEELENVEADLEQQEREQSSKYVDAESGTVYLIPELSLKKRVKRKFLSFVSLSFIKVFTMIFLAEWGDRSQISTMILAASENPCAVVTGALLGHSLCTGGAVLGGKLVAEMISVRTVTLVGGIIFITFATVSLLLGK